MPIGGFTEEKREIEGGVCSDRFEEPIQNISIIGVGGAGASTINRIYEIMERDRINLLSTINKVATDTDDTHLRYVKADKRLMIGKKRRKGLIIEGIPQVGEEAARESEKDIKKLIERADIVFITCGLGGGTGTGAAPVIAEIARDSGALTIAIVTFPFSAEGTLRRANAEAGLERLREVADTVIVVPNDKLLEVVPEYPMSEAFNVVRDVIAGVVYSIAKLGVKGLFTLRDLASVVVNGDLGKISFSKGERYELEKLVRQTVQFPLCIEHVEPSKALVAIISDGSVGPSEVQNVVSEIANHLKLRECDVRWGSLVDPSINGIEISIIATAGKGRYSKLFLPMVKKHSIDFL